MKTNFKNNESLQNSSDAKVDEPKNDLTQEEFEEYISKSGARGSFMVYRSNKSDDEWGIDEL